MYSVKYWENGNIIPDFTNIQSLQNYPRFICSPVGRRLIDADVIKYGTYIDTYKANGGYICCSPIRVFSVIAIKKHMDEMKAKMISVGFATTYRYVADCTMHTTTLEQTTRSYEFSDDYGDGTKFLWKQLPMTEKTYHPRIGVIFDPDCMIKCVQVHSNLQNAVIPTRIRGWGVRCTKMYFADNNRNIKVPLISRMFSTTNCKSIPVTHNVYECDYTYLHDKIRSHFTNKVETETLLRAIGEKFSIDTLIDNSDLPYKSSKFICFGCYGILYDEIYVSVTSDFSDVYSSCERCTRATHDRTTRVFRTRCPISYEMVVSVANTVYTRTQIEFMDYIHKHMIVGVNSVINYYTRNGEQIQRLCLYTGARVSKNNVYQPAINSPIRSIYIEQFMFIVCGDKYICYMDDLWQIAHLYHHEIFRGRELVRVVL
jgi:hypothetical protein